jgi:outer membrane lipoprotein-sorting protein
LFVKTGVCHLHKGQTGPPVNTDELIKKMFKASADIKSLKYTFVCNERVEGKMVTMKSAIKLQTTPRQLYLNCAQAEILYAEGKNNNKALVHPFTFPYFNVNLDPNHSFMRKGQHHTINEAGFGYFVNVLKLSLAHKDAATNLHIVYNGEEQFSNRPCYKFTVVNKSFGYREYKVGQKENMITIARKLNVSEYMILEINNRYSSYTDVNEEDVIKVPTAYSKMTVLFIDQQNYLPIGSRVYDDKGLFESYEYNELQVNPVISREEFTRDYKEYSF